MPEAMASTSSRPTAEYWKRWWDQQAGASGSDYALNRGTTVRLDELEQRSLRQFLASVNPQATDVVLDAGCGSGRNISILSPLVREIVGVDYSEQMLKHAEIRVAEEKLCNVKLMTGDITALQFPTSAFDKVICASVLQYLDDDQCAVALRELVRVCKPGGTLVLHLKNGASLYGLSLKVLRPIARALGRNVKPEYYRTRSWHEEVLQFQGAERVHFDGFGLCTFVPLPRWGVAQLLRLETRVPLPHFLKQFAVNYQVTLRVNKPIAGSSAE